MVWAQIEICGITTNIASVYIPPERTDQLLLFIANLEFIIQLTKLPVLVCGDFNSRSYSWEAWHTSHTETVRENFVSFRNGQLVEEAAVNLDFIIANTGTYTRFEKGIFSSPDIFYYQR